MCMRISVVEASANKKYKLKPKKGKPFTEGQHKDVVEFVIQEIGGAEGDRWRCRRLFYVVPLKTQNMCCRMNRRMSHAFLTQVMCFSGLYQSVMPQKRPREHLGISLVSSEIQKMIQNDVDHPRR